MFNVVRFARVRRMILVVVAFLVFTSLAGELVFALVMHRWSTATLFECKYLFTIRQGMSRQEVEDQLGPGTETVHIPVEGGKPVVSGDLVLVWLNGNMEIYIGFRNGEVSCKWFFAPGVT